MSLQSFVRTWTETEDASNIARNWATANANRLTAARRRHFGFGGANAGQRTLQSGVFRQHPVHQPVELRIVKGFPPIGLQLGRRRTRQTQRSRRDFALAGRGGRRLHAASQRQRQKQCGGQALAQIFPQRRRSPDSSFGKITCAARSAQRAPAAKPKSSVID